MFSVVPIIINKKLSLEDFPLINAIVDFVSSTPWAQALLSLLVFVALCSFLLHIIKIIWR